MSCKRFTDEEAEALAGACTRGDSNAVANMLGKSMFGGSQYKELWFDISYKLTGPKAVKCLAAEIPPDLEVLCMDLRGCNMLAEGAIALAQGIPSKLTKMTLCVQNNKIGDKGAAAIYEKLPRTLEILNLNTYGVVVGTEAAKVFAKNMPPKLKELELDMCDGAVGDEGMVAISQSLPKTIERLWLHLQGNKLTCRGQYIFDRQIDDDMNPYHLPLLKNENFKKWAGLEPEVPMWKQDPITQELIRQHAHEC
eukprot:gnl/MRDRNA2_/MRDRNA2_122828_c0_seq1.p1 gnl/MRDRNA2_/MRDRNA2_122828_c0~~gnl/MRDRNA2_/MRDRNA2_122828_c0_seq1.p1  ORF type:complete len:278 (-),score=63.12 gnl/MRDRNA2_/MRDRNA2_122828_c0_seq1:169-924(-)